MSKPNFTEQQLATITAAVADPHEFITRRFIEAIITMDGDEHNKYITDTLKVAKSRGLDLLIKLLQTRTEAKGSLPTASEALARAQEPPLEPEAPLKLVQE